MKTPKTASVPSCSELHPPHTPPHIPVMALDSLAARRKKKTVVEVASDSDDDKPTSNVKSVHQSHHHGM